MPKIRYRNMGNVKVDKTFKELREWRGERRRKKKDFSFAVPGVTPRVDYLMNNRRETTITWIGHSTFFIQYEGLNIITDPVWAERMGFERRLAPPGMRIGEVPPIDLILISHSHYDHMHLPSIRRLYRAETKLIVPAGLKRKMIRKGFRNCMEMQWWESVDIGRLKLSFVPAQHWTRRTPFDTDTSHWGGYILEPGNPGDRMEQGGEGEQLLPHLYFAGDSGYFPGFKEIGRRFQIDVALMPIGAYEPEWFMALQHVNPEEAVQAFLDVGAETMIPMHYGSFRLADDTAQEALDRMEAARALRGIAEERIKVLGNGETLVIPPVDAKHKKVDASLPAW
ncbi:MBL fold metallo-hydrolase [Paenibacillus sp. HN-1]|uniref:MBL fold metallo-hydrolase n=1 Tax=Paenibacillus TaxID=44249 RepID=UPI001CA925FC|nr:MULTISPECIES: MBL fold metallo-hydrolase [Paenibacillus]MBY9077039.1 MBL fold metallo-hydrolase [Paenibacillus sp. CGMCC 1.18879]MBY9086588.1 MBL fold metallo-hydrolase [Paenibacillus sinensis]